MCVYLPFVIDRMKISVVIVLVCVMCLGCGPSNTKSLGSMDVVQPAIATVVVEVPPKVAPRNFADVLLEQADMALREGRLVSPAHDNAFDRFQSVLILSPGNSIARSGLQAILVNMSSDVRNAIAGKQFYSARQQLKQLDVYFPNTALVDDLQQDLRTAQAKEKVRIEVDAPPPQGDYEDVVLSAEELTRRSEALQQQLKEVADKIVANDYMVMIYARSDREGRWIYKQLKEGAEGYRVRGDIRIGKPKLRLLPPL